MAGASVTTAPTEADDDEPSWWAGTRGRWLLAGFLIALLTALVGAYFALDGARYLTLDAIRARQSELGALYAAHPLSVLALFFVTYVAVTALSLPVATLMTLTAGAIFGVLTGTIVVSFAASIGATLAFLASRYLFRAGVERRFAARMAEIDRGIDKDGAFYLFMLRLVPIVPFFLINLLMGLTRLRVGVFYVVTQVAMLAGTAIYVNAGTQLARTQRLTDIVSPVLLASFALLGIFPWLAKRLVEGHGRRRLHARWRRPRRYARNLVVIGSGAAALAAARAAALAGAAVTRIDADPPGAADLLAIRTWLRRAAHQPGFERDHPALQRTFAAAQARARRAQPDGEEADVDVRHGRARIVDPWRVEITAADGSVATLTTRSIVIAAGSDALLPDLPGLPAGECLTPESLLQLDSLPRRLIVLGGGAIGCELAQGLARHGAAVVLVEPGARLLASEDEDVAARVTAALVRDGVQVLTGQRALRCETDAAGMRCLVVEPTGAGDEDEAGGAEAADVADEACEAGQTTGEVQHIGFDRVLSALGRRPRLAGFGLEELGIATDEPLQTDAWLRTLYPDIYAAGGVVDPAHGASRAAHQGWHAATNALFGGLRRFKPDYRSTPRAVFVDPEVAAVGVDEQRAREQGLAYELTACAFAGAGGTSGHVKVLTVPGRDRVLGAVIVAADAAQQIAEFVLAMQQGIGLSRLLRTPHLQPASQVASLCAAAAWRRDHPPRLGWARRYHAWRRG